MREMRERLDGGGELKATMLQAHFAWVEQRVPDMRQRLGPESRRFFESQTLATAWVPFRTAIAIDRELAALVGGRLEDVWRQMGRHSARLNLGGVYKAFVKGEPHRFFTRMTILHRRFQSFGTPAYEDTGERSGRIRIEGCRDYSPVYCASALGYYEGALEMMKVPGPVRAREVSCQCAGEPVCLFDLSW